MNEPQPPSQAGPNLADAALTRSHSVLARAVHRLRTKSIAYWVAAFLVLIVAKAGSPYVYDYFNLGDARSRLFQTLLEWGPRPAEPRFVKIVRIQDDEYWQGPLVGRRPIKRDYLATLIDRLVSLDVHVIGIDFDARLPNPDSMEIPDEYRTETRTLIDAIKAAARKGKKVVLATPISFAADNIYRRDSDIYQASGICPDRQIILGNADDADPITANVSCGFIALPDDPLRIPPVIDLQDGSRMDPFALALARAANPDLISRLIQRKKELGYLDFITHDSFVQANSLVSARALRLGEIAPGALNSKVVLIGAAWSRDASDRGPPVDAHPTPVGDMVGVEMHANFAEALLDSRVFDSVSQQVLEISEVVFGIFAAIVFAIIPHFWGKLLGFLALLLFMFGISAVALRGFGMFFDAFVPLVGLAIHTLYESYAHRAEAAETSH